MNYKKEASQRQREKAAKAAKAAAAAAPAVTPSGPSGPVEEATNPSEAKIFAVLDAMGIGHVGVGAE